MKLIRLFLQLKSKDDKLVLKRHKEIYPSKKQLDSIQLLVQVVESALKNVADKIHEEEMTVYASKLRSDC